jgi:hypothetical protein
MLHQKETEGLRAYPTHQAVQTTGSSAVVDLAGQYIEHSIPLPRSESKLLPNKTDSGDGK